MYGCRTELLKAHANGRNKRQQVPTLLWFHANGRNKSQHCWAQQCWVLLANNVGSVCMGLNKDYRKFQNVDNQAKVLSTKLRA